MFSNPTKYVSQILQNSDPYCYGIGPSQQIFFPFLSYHLVEDKWLGRLLFVEAISSSLWIINWNQLEEIKVITIERSLTEELIQVLPYKSDFIATISTNLETKQQILQFFSLENLDFVDFGDSLNTDAIIESVELESTSRQPLKWYHHNSNALKILSFALSSSRGTVCLELEKFHVILMDAENEEEEEEENEDEEEEEEGKEEED